MCAELINYQMGFGLIISILGGTVGWCANVFWERSKYKREQRTYYWKEKINASKKATEFYMEYLNLLNLFRLQFKLYKDNIIDGESLLVLIQQKEIEFYSQKLKQFPHNEYHHINLFYKLVEDYNFKIVNENTEILQKINRINQSKVIKDNEVIELFGKMGDNYEKLYNNLLLQLETVQNDLENEGK